MSTEEHRNLATAHLNRLRRRAVWLAVLSAGVLFVAEGILEYLSRRGPGLLINYIPRIAAIVLVGYFFSRFAIALFRQSRAAALQSSEGAIRLEKRFRALIENGTDMIVLLSGDGGVRYVSPSVSRMVGYSAQEILGRSLLDVIVPDDHGRIKNDLNELCRKPENLRSDTYRIYHKDGSWHWISVQMRNLLADPNVAAIVCNARDITDWKLTNDSLRSLTNGVPVGIYRTTSSGEFLAANPALTQMLGYSDEREAFISNAMDLYVDPGDRVRWQELMARKGSVRNFEFRALRRDGTIIWVRDSGRAVRDEHKGITYYEGALEDITDRKQAEQALLDTQVNS